MPKPLTIGALAKEVGVPVSTVRYYERRGLLEPESRSNSAYREYGPKSRRRLQFLINAKASGFTLEDIRTLLDQREGGGSCSEVAAIVRARLAQIHAERERLAALEEVLTRSLTWCESGGKDGTCPVLGELEPGSDSLE